MCICACIMCNCAHTMTICARIMCNCALIILVNTYLITRELRILQHGVNKISSGEFGYKIQGKEVSTEVKELFDAFNDMSTRLHLYEKQNVEHSALEKNKL